MHGLGSGRITSRECAEIRPAPAGPPEMRKSDDHANPLVIQLELSTNTDGFQLRSFDGGLSFGFLHYDWRSNGDLEYG